MTEPQLAPNVDKAARKALVEIISTIQLPKKLINDEMRIVGDAVDPKIIKKIAKELVQYVG